MKSIDQITLFSIPRVSPGVTCEHAKEGLAEDDDSERTQELRSADDCATYAEHGGFADKLTNPTA